MKKVFRYLFAISFPLMLIGVVITGVGLQGQPDKIWWGFYLLVASLLLTWVAIVTFIMLNDDWFKSQEEMDKTRNMYYKAYDTYTKAVKDFSDKFLQSKI